MFPGYRFVLRVGVCFLLFHTPPPPGISHQVPPSRWRMASPQWHCPYRTGSLAVWLSLPPPTPGPGNAFGPGPDPLVKCLWSMPIHTVFLSMSPPDHWFAFFPWSFRYRTTQYPLFQYLWRTPSPFLWLPRWKTRRFSCFRTPCLISTDVCSSFKLHSGSVVWIYWRDNVSFRFGLPHNLFIFHESSETCRIYPTLLASDPNGRLNSTLYLMAGNTDINVGPLRCFLSWFCSIRWFYVLWATWMHVSKFRSANFHSKTYSKQIVMILWFIHVILFRYILLPSTHDNNLLWQ